MKKTSQKERVLNWLKTGRTLTPIEALNNGMGMRLADIVFRLKKEGHNIENIGDTKFGKYKLMSKGGMLNL